MTSPTPRTSTTCGPSASAWATCSRGWTMVATSNMSDAGRAACRPGRCPARRPAHRGRLLRRPLPALTGPRCRTVRPARRLADQGVRRGSTSIAPGRAGGAIEVPGPRCVRAAVAPIASGGRRRHRAGRRHPGRDRPLRLRGGGVRRRPPAGPAGHRRRRSCSACSPPRTLGPGPRPLRATRTTTGEEGAGTAVEMAAPSCAIDQLCRAGSTGATIAVGIRRR